MSKPTILPFRSLRYNLDKIDHLSHVIAPPYDVINDEQQKALYAKSNHNIAWLDVTQEGSGEPSAERYAKAAADFQSWQDNAILSRDAEPGIYVYEQVFVSPEGEEFTRRGFYALRRLEAFGEGSVYPHEKTLSGPKKDRLQLMKATSTQMSPIFALFREQSGTAGKLLLEAVIEKPLFEIDDDTNQTHRLWHVTDPEWIKQLQKSVQDSPYLIADGHHRYETALAYSKWRQDEKPNPEADYVLMFCEEMSDPGLLVLPTHRIAHSRPNFDAGDFLTRVNEFFDVQESTQANWQQSVTDAGKDEHRFGLQLQGDDKRYVASIKTADLVKIPALKAVNEPLRSLDAAILHKFFLEAVLGFTAEDQETTDYIAYLKSTDAFHQRMQDSSSQVGVLVNPAPLPQIRQIAEAGQFMPPKTTYFYPKLPTGLVIQLID